MIFARKIKIPEFHMIYARKARIFHNCPKKYFSQMFFSIIFLPPPCPTVSYAYGQILCQIWLRAEQLQDFQYSDSDHEL